jgi:hypothetical protein
VPWIHSVSSENVVVADSASRSRDILKQRYCIDLRAARPSLAEAPLCSTAWTRDAPLIGAGMSNEGAQDPPGPAIGATARPAVVTLNQKVGGIVSCGEWTRVLSWPNPVSLAHRLAVRPARSATLAVVVSAAPNQTGPVCQFAKSSRRSILDASLGPVHHLWARSPLSVPASSIEFVFPRQRTEGLNRSAFGSGNEA